MPGDQNDVIYRVIVKLYTDCILVYANEITPKR